MRQKFNKYHNDECEIQAQIFLKQTIPLRCDTSDVISERLSKMPTYLPFRPQPTIHSLVYVPHALDDNTAEFWTPISRSGSFTC